MSHKGDLVNSSLISRTVWLLAEVYLSSLPAYVKGSMSLLQHWRRSAISQGLGPKFPPFRDHTSILGVYLRGQYVHHPIGVSLLRPFSLMLLANESGKV